MQFLHHKCVLPMTLFRPACVNFGNTSHSSYIVCAHRQMSVCDEAGEAINECKSNTLVFTWLPTLNHDHICPRSLFVQLQPEISKNPVWLWFCSCPLGVRLSHAQTAQYTTFGLGELFKSFSLPLVIREFDTAWPWWDGNQLELVVISLHYM